MSETPVDLPPGLERRRLMEAHGLNITLDDFTAEERADIERKADAARAEFASMAAEDNASS